MRPAEREMAAASWQRTLAPLLERRTGPRKVALEPDVAPATVWTPSLLDTHPAPARDAFVRSRAAATPLPASDADIAFAPVTQLSRWIETEAAHVRAAHAHLSRSASTRSIRSCAASSR